jgi:hypothetical protein
MVTRTLFTAFLVALFSAVAVFPLVCLTACDENVGCPMSREHSDCCEGGMSAAECSCCLEMSATPGKFPTESEFPRIWKPAVSPVGEADPVGQELEPDRVFRPTRASRYRFVQLYTLHSVFLI